MGEAYEAVADATSPARGLRPDRPGPLGLGRRPAGRGLDKVEKIKAAKKAGWHLRPPADAQGDPQPRGRLGRAVVERRDPGRAGRDPRPASGRPGPGGRDPDRRVLPRRREEGREDRRDPAERRGRGQLPHAAEPQGGRAAPRRDHAQRGARPASRTTTGATSPSRSSRP